MENTKTNTIIIGAGQSGLSLSFLLTQKKVDHVVLEKGKIAQEWRERRWNAFRLITPNYMTTLPGLSYKGKNPNGFNTRDQMVNFFDKYAKSFNAPVRQDTKVLSVKKNKNGFEVKTNNGIFSSKNVVVAIGSFHKPHIPKASKSIPERIFQIHSSEYKNSKQLPKGAILVVGSGNSGIQIASDLQKSHRKVYLSVGKLRIVPRFYRGKDFMRWAQLMGVLDRKAQDATDEIKNTTPPALFGTTQTVNLIKLAKNGIQLVGHLKKFSNGTLTFEDDLETNLEKGEAALSSFKNAVDSFIAQKRIKAPKEKPTTIINFKPKRLLELNAKKITSIVWATGFVDDYSFLRVSTFDKSGQPIHKKGESKIPGLYFIGLRWLSKYKSFLLCGVEEDARYLAKLISKRK